MKRRKGNVTLSLSLGQSNVARLTIKEVSNFVQIDFKIGNFNVKLDVLVHRVDVVEDVVHDSRYDAHVLAIVEHTLHRVRLARRRLAVGEDGAVVAAEHILDDRLRRLIVHLLLAGVRLEYFVEGESFALSEEKKVNKVNKMTKSNNTKIIIL